MPKDHEKLIINDVYSSEDDISIVSSVAKNKFVTEIQEKPKFINQNFLSNAFGQTKLIIWKNYLVFSRNLKQTIFMLLTPIMICLILVILQAIIDKYTANGTIKNPDLLPLNKIPKCVIPEDCVTVGIGIIVNTY